MGDGDLKPTRQECQECGSHTEADMCSTCLSFDLVAVGTKRPAGAAQSDLPWFSHTLGRLSLQHGHAEATDGADGG